MGYKSYGFSLEQKSGGSKKTFFGKYRAIVTNNNDRVDKMGRIKVKCPAILGDGESNWCNPCFPYAGVGVGMVFLPKVGDTVWVEFEEGNPDLPIWTGNWYALKEIPSEVYTKLGDLHVIKTHKGSITFNDSTGQVLIKGDDKVIIDGDLEVKGTVTADKSISATGNISTSGNVSASGNISAGGTVSGSNIV